MKPILCFMLLTSLVVASRTPALASSSDSVMCSDGIVSRGDVTLDLLRKCGQPTYATQREEKVVDDNGAGERIITTIVIDDWTYNFGSDRFMYRILLKDGRVWRIESLGYGY